MQQPSEATAPSAAWTAQADPLVSLRDVYKTFPSGRQTVRAVDGVTLDILQGETLGLVGESGCGKSTLGRVVTQLQPASAGSILFEGKDLAALHGEELRRIRTGDVETGELDDTKNYLMGVVPATVQSSSDIASRLGISEKTVRNHLSSVFLKLQVNDRTAAALKARHAGLGNADPAHPL